MSTISTGVGLYSGIDIAGLVDSLIEAQSGTVTRLEERVSVLEAENTAVKLLEANVLSISTAAQELGRASTFEAFQVDVSDSSVLNVTADSSATPGRYVFQSIRQATTHQLRSRGFANADQQAIGSGTLTISSTGNLHRSTLLDALNSGEGIRQGTIRVTDRSGASADIDLSNAYSIDDVLSAINDADTISVEATTYQGRIVLTDTSGQTTSNLSVVDLAGGGAAEDLGIRHSIADSTLTGESVYSVWGDYTLDQINDGNGLYRVSGAPDLEITLTDDSVISVNLDDAVTLSDVVNTINNHDDNGGKLLASLTDGHLELTDLSGGGGTSAFAVQDANGASVVRQLGLDESASGNVLTGHALLAGFNSVLLRNLRGGQGIDQTGQITLTDRSGTTATVDLTNAESLDEVLYAINTAQSGSGTDLELVARVDSTGTGIEVVDTSGGSGNLVIADVGGSTLADQLGIAVNASQSSVASGSLSHRGVNEATQLSDYAPDGGGVAQGSILIIDSAGNQEAISISSAVQTLGDVLQRINAAQNVSVRAELNETGDGFVLIDEAGGPDALRVQEVDSSTAADLRILGEGSLVSGQYQISSRRATTVEIDADDTLNDLAEKINESGGFVQASVVNDGSAFNSYRLMLTSKTQGTAGRVTFDSGSVDLGFTTTVQGNDALLRVGDSSSNGFVIASASDTFSDAAPGIDVTLLGTSDTDVIVDVSRDTGTVKNSVQKFVNSYNTFLSTVDQLTAYDPETEARGVLQGSNVVLRISSRLSRVLNREFLEANETVRSLVDLGIGVGSDGQLRLDDEKLDQVLQADFDSVSEFFQDSTSGFAGAMDSAVTSLTDSYTGTFALEEESLQTSVDTLTERIMELAEILEVRRERMLQEFLVMEEILGTLSSQETAISQISLVKKNSSSS